MAQVQCGNETWKAPTMGPGRISCADPPGYDLTPSQVSGPGRISCADPPGYDLTPSQVSGPGRIRTCDPSIMSRVL